MEIGKIEIPILKMLVGDIIDYPYEHYNKMIVSKKIVALKNNKRVLIDLPKGVF